MKTLFSFILCGLAAFNIAAQTPSASATFFSQDGQKFWVIMDGIKQNDKPDANVKVTGLTNPNYRAKIIFADNTIPSIDKNIFTKDVDDKFFDATYNIQKDKKGKLVVRVSSFSESKGGPASAQTVPFHTDDKYGSDYTIPNTPAQTIPIQNTTQTTTTTTRGNTGTVNQNVNSNVGGDKVGINQNVTGGDKGVSTSQTITDPSGNTVKMDMNMGATGGGVKVDDGMGGTIDMNMGINMPAGSTTTTTTKTTTTTTYSSTNTGGAVTTRPPSNTGSNTTPPPSSTTPPANTGCTFPASSTDIGNLKGSIQKQSFSDSKMNVAKTFLKNKCLSVAQIKDVMALFSFEGDKLSFAKLAYDRCSDKENYYMVSDAFSFSSSSDELTDFINSK